MLPIKPAELMLFPTGTDSLAVASLVHAIRTSGRLPFGTHSEQVDEEVVRQGFRPPGEDAMC
jgi:hypothetical protein